MRLNGAAIDPTATYRVPSNNFLTGGGDGFTKLTVGTRRVVAPRFDIDALVAYLGASPAAPGPVNRISRE
jgi:5'-nucleotidase